jgi:hypothetical protein
MLSFKQGIVLGITLFHQTIILCAAQIGRSAQLTKIMTLR